MAESTERIVRSVAELAQTLDKAAGTITEAEAGLLISGFVFEQFGRTLRRFDYRQEFPAEAPACRPAFTRTLAHEDWIDGESVVQAGQTPTELGFNERFHQIEADLDALWANIRLTGDCLAEMRRALRTLLDEIRAEINQIYSDIHELSADTGRPTVGPARTPSFSGLISQSKFQGNITLGQQQGSIWETPLGFVVLPQVLAATAGPRLSTSARDNDAVLLGRFISGSPQIQRRFQDRRFTKEELIGGFGQERLADGRTLAEVIDPLPANTPFASLDALVDAVAGAQAERIRLLPDGAQVITDSFNENVPIERVADAPLAEATFLSPPLRDALVRGGVTTVGALSQLNARRIAELARNANVALADPDAAEAAAAARFLVHLR